MKKNSWFGESERHRGAALKGWEKRKKKAGNVKGRKKSLLKKGNGKIENIKLTPKEKFYLPNFRDQVIAGEAGKRVITESGEWTGYGSSYPDWMRNKGWSRKEVLRVFDILEQGGNFKKRNKKQLAIADGIIEAIKNQIRVDSHISRMGGGASKRQSIARSYRLEDEGLPAWVLENPARALQGVTREQILRFIELRSRVYGGKNKYLKSQEYRKLYPYLKKVWSVNQGKPKNNPVKAKKPVSAPKGAIKIYENILAIEAVKGKESHWPKEVFRHDFSIKKGKASVFGMPDGSLQIKGEKRLWKEFNYPGRKKDG